MQNSKVIEIQGIFVGAAARLPGAQGWQLVAADPRLMPIDGAIAASFAELQSKARQAFLAYPVPKLTGSTDNAGCLV